MKKKKDEEVDISALPPWLPISVNLIFNTTKEKSQQIMADLNASTYTIKRFITRNEIINFGKEKGMYIDPSQINDKQKKDKNAGDIPTELTPALLAKMYAAFYNEVNLTARKNKKEKLDAIASGKDLAQKKADAKDSKKDNKKDAKGTKVEVVVEEKKEEPPLDQIIPKALDFIYFFVDFPTTKEEFTELSKTGMALDLILQLDEKNIKVKAGLSQDISQLDNRDDIEPDQKSKLEEFDQNGNIKNTEKDRNNSIISTEDTAFMKKNTLIPKNMQKARKESLKGDPIRNTVFNEILAIFNDSYTHEENLHNITRQIYEHICQFSFYIVEYNEWLKDKKPLPFYGKKEDYNTNKQDHNIEQRPGTSEIGNRPQSSDQKLEPKDDKKQSKADLTKPGPIKPTSAVPKKLGAAGAPQEEDKKDKTTESVPEIKKEEENKPMQKTEREIKIQNYYYYNRQLASIKNDHISPGIILESLLDQVTYINTDNPSASQHSVDDINLLVSNMSEQIFGLNTTIIPENKIQDLDNEAKESPFHKLYDESDQIARKALQNKLYDDELNEQREHQTFDKIKLPGIDRVTMPDKPEKSENLRKAEKAQIYPFISFEISDFERYIALEMFEALMKEKVSERVWNFGDRIYEERHSKNTLSQTLFQALLFDPEIATKYSDKDDSLLLSLYFRNPAGRILKKKWINDWKVLPNLESWINFFKTNEKNLKNDFYYDIDYQIIGHVYENLKLMYPADDSVIMCTHFQIGDQLVHNFKVLKENVMFGIRRPFDKTNPYIEFWALFENQTKLMVEMEKDTNKEGLENAEMIQDQSIIKEDNFYCTFNITLQNGLVLKYLANGDILQTIPKQDPTTTKLFSEDGQNDESTNQITNDIEINRIITGKSTVIRYMEDGSIQILYANGNIAMHNKNGIWITINNKGFKKGHRIQDGSEIEYDPIPCARKTDPETGCKILIREDKVMVITYPDGSKYTVHKDGTRFLTSADGNSYIVEHDNYATVKVTYDPEKSKRGPVIGEGGSFASLGFDNIMQRSYTGRVTETFLADGTKIVGYKEKKESSSGVSEVSDIHLLYLPDGTVAKIQSNGEVILIGANDRVALNEKGQNRENNNDIDYFLQLFASPEERKGGVYTCELVKKYLWTKDDEGNFFSVHSTGETEGRVAASFNFIVNPDHADFEKPESPDELDPDFIDEENKFLPPPDKVIHPRLFLISNANLGSELLNHDQLKHYLTIKENDPRCHKLIENQIPGISNCESLTFLTQYLTLDEAKKYFINVKIPNVDIIPNSITVKKQSVVLKYLYRNLLKYTEFDETKRQILQSDMEKYQFWKKNQQKEAYEFGLKERSLEDKEREYSIQEKILNFRKTNNTKQTYQMCKLDFISNKFDEIYDNDIKESTLINQKTQENLSQKFKTRTKRKGTPEVKIIHREEEDIYPFPFEVNFKEVDLNNIRFLPNYYQTLQGTNFQKWQPKYDGEEIKRQKEENKKTQQILQQEQSLISQKSANTIVSVGRGRTQEKPAEVTQNSAKVQNVTTKKKSTSPSPSFSKLKDLERKKIQEDFERSSEKYHAAKTEKYDVYGNDRKSKEFVSSLSRPIPIKELNTKFIAIEAAVDRRVKISSMANRVHLNAPSVESMRNTAEHEMLKKSMDKRYNLDGLHDQKNLMMTAAFDDKLKRDLLLLPTSARFGNLKSGSVYEFIIKIKNEDPIAQRVTIKPPADTQISITQNPYGPIAMGMTKDIIIQLNTAGIIGQINEEIEIISKHDIYKIPIAANIMETNAWNKLDQESRQLNKKSILKASVREIKSNKPGGTDNPSPKDSYMESGLSDGAFPRLVFDKNTKLEAINNNNQRRRIDDSSYVSDSQSLHH